MAQKVLVVYVGQSLWRNHIWPKCRPWPSSPKNFWGVKSFHYFFYFWLHKI